jgi:hypothetical protein
LVNQDVHFVAELIQNADDSDFNPGATPTKHFALGRGEDRWPHAYLLVACNERGFSEQDV